MSAHTTAKLFLICAFAAGVCTQGADTETYVFSTMKQWKLKTSSDVVDEIKTSNVLQCTRACKDNTDCVSINVLNQNHGHVCQLLARTANVNNTNLEEDPTSDFISLVSPRRCFNGGKWNDSINRCSNCSHGFVGDLCERRIRDCQEGAEVGYTGEEIISIQPTHAVTPFLVNCKYQWGRTYIERRGVDFCSTCWTFLNFNRNLSEFKTGFGDFNSEYFLGLEKLHQLTSHRISNLKIELRDAWSFVWHQVWYKEFTIGDNTNNFVLHYKSFGTVPPAPGDGFGMGAPNSSVQNAPFCTPDNDCGSCADASKSGWWFNTDCSEVNLHSPMAPPVPSVSPGVLLTWPGSTGSDIVVDSIYWMLESVDYFP